MGKDGQGSGRKSWLLVHVLYGWSRAKKLIGFSALYLSRPPQLYIHLFIYHWRTLWMTPNVTRRIMKKLRMGITWWRGHTKIIRSGAHLVYTLVYNSILGAFSVSRPFEIPGISINLGISMEIQDQIPLLEGLMPKSPGFCRGATFTTVGFL